MMNKSNYIANISVNGSSIQISNRNNSNKNDILKSGSPSSAIVRRIFLPIKSESNTAAKEKIRKNQKFRKHKKIKFKTTIKNSYANREVLQIPCFTFPRYGENYSYNGRKTLCNQYNNELLSKELIKIRELSATSDFEKLLKRHQTYLKHFNNLIGNSHQQQDHSKQHNHPVRLLTKDNINNLIKYHKLDREIRTKKFGRYKIRYQENSFDGYTNGNNIKNENESVQQLNHLINLASQYYYEGFQCHLDYLNYCMHKGASIKQRYLERHKQTKSTSATVKINSNASNNTNSLQYHNNQLSDIENFSVGSCNKSNSDFSDFLYKRQSSNTSAESIISNKTKYELYNSKVTKKISNIMNNCINLNNNSSNINRNSSLNNVIEDFYKLNISKRGLRPPQITFTDFSTITTDVATQPTSASSSASFSSLSSFSSSASTGEEVTGTAALPLLATTSATFDECNIYANNCIENYKQSNCFNFNVENSNAINNLENDLQKCLSIPSYKQFYNGNNSESRPPSSTFN